MIKNKTRNTIISKDFKLLKDFRSKSKGLINSKTPETVVFYTRFGIHTFGMKYPIDVIVTGKKLKVSSIKENLRPNRVFLWNPKNSLVIELENGTVKRSQTEINDFLEINL
jgi:uncharacterized membrane protein (UPF0127 family)